MAIEPIKGFYVHDEETNTDGVAKVSIDAVQEFEDDIRDETSRWLDEHPEASTTVLPDSLTTDKYKDESITAPKLANGAVTSVKVDTEFLREIKNAYVTPEQFGAVGDGMTDDTQAIESAVATGSPVVFTLTYLVTNNITIPAGTVLKGYKELTSAHTEIIFTENHGLVLAGRNITIKNITLTQKIEGTGTALLINTDAYGIILDGLIVNGFNIGIDRRVALWNSIIANCRFNYCTIVYNSTNANGGTQTTTISNIHVNRCTQIFNCQYGDKLVCINCNFGIIQFPAFTSDTSSTIFFIGCNFECDGHIETGTNMFTVGTRGASFDQCLFKINSYSDGHIFALANPTFLEFTNCFYEAITGNEMPDDNFFNIGYFTTAVYGAVRFNGGNKSIPRPSTNLTTARWPNWIDVERGKPIEFYQTNILKDKLYRGEILYSYTNKALCVYDGTNIVNVRTGDVVL